MNPWELIGWVLLAPAAGFAVGCVVVEVNSVVDQVIRKRIQREQLAAETQRFSGKDI